MTGRDMVRRGSVPLGIVLLAVAACATQPPSPEPTAPERVAALPTIGLVGRACRGIGLDGTLSGNPADPRVAWLATSAGRMDVVFPAGFTARFAPSLEVLDASGLVVAHEGTAITGGCTTGPNAQGPVLILVP